MRAAVSVPCLTGRQLECLPTFLRCCSFLACEKSTEREGWVTAAGEADLSGGGGSSAMKLTVADGRRFFTGGGGDVAARLFFCL